MAGSACVVFDKTLTDYDFGPTHPMSPIRVDLTMLLAEELGLVGGRGMPSVPAPVASDDLVGTVHGARFMEAVERTGRDPNVFDEAHGLGTPDNPTFEGASRRVEAYVLDRNDLDLYGKRVAIEFVYRIRGMVPFAGVDGLIDAMHGDVEATRRILGIGSPR